LNYAPAVTEAYYQQVPLLVLTADRPAEWIEQQDGQTIRQREVYGKHVKASFELPVSFLILMQSGILTGLLTRLLPLPKLIPMVRSHINIPLREPLYPAANETINSTKCTYHTTFSSEQILVH
jgi:2-succinyl-5-enolpyruvyl-6-hydroxy-3-cyclohexene-1-carboxylate synthase